MPRVSEFYGIVIAMFYNEHGPAHFHAVYGEHHASVGIDPVRIVEGSLPPRTLRLVREWAATHQHELQDDWLRAREHRPLLPIEPLE